MYEQIESLLEEFVQTFQDEVCVTEGTCDAIARFEMLGDQLLEQAAKMQEFAGVEFTDGLIITEL